MPTTRAAAVLFLSVLAWVGAAVWHYPELGMVAIAGLLGLALGALWMIWRPHLMFRREIEPSRVERGNLALARLSIRDGRARILMLLRDRAMW